MCYQIVIGTNQELEVGSFIPNETLIYFEKLDQEIEASLRSKFTKRNLYFVGSDTCCSCGLNIDYELESGQELSEINKSPLEFIRTLNELTKNENVELYCCWDGDEKAPIESKRIINIEEITLDNYLNLNEREFITFKMQSN